MQRLQIAWSDCLWTPKVSRVSQVKSARPYLVRHSTDIRDKVRSSIQVQSCPFALYHETMPMVMQMTRQMEEQ